LAAVFEGQSAATCQPQQAAQAFRPMVSDRSTALGQHPHVMQLVDYDNCMTRPLAIERLARHCVHCLLHEVANRRRTSPTRARQI
jgi:hypothetical protein